MENIKSTDEILTVEETAKFLKICRVKAYNMFNQKDFPCIKIGKSMRVYKSDLLDFIRCNLNTNNR